MRNTELQLVITDAAGLALLEGLDIGVPSERFLLVDDPAYGDLVAKHACEPTRDPAIDATTQLSAALHVRHDRRVQGGPLQPGAARRARPDERREVRRTAHDVSYCCMPLFHGNALMALWAPSLVVGRDRRA